MTDEELSAAKEEIHDTFADVREALAEELGGEPEDYKPAPRRATDGGEE
jgi:hypothetical protein